MEVTIEGAADTARIFASSPLNGDGVIPVSAADDPATQALIKDIIDCLGAASRPSGDVGVTSDKIEAFFTQLAAYGAWSDQKAALEASLLGGATESAFDAIKAVRAKVDDYFARCRLAAFDSRAAGALNRDEADYRPIASHELKLSEELSGFPLSRIEAGKPLGLAEGVNPAWVAALGSLREKAVAPILGASKTSLTDAEWTSLVARFAEYEAWLGANGGRAVEKIGLARTKEILSGNGREALGDLVSRDKALGPQFRAVSDVERPGPVRPDLRALLHNFVNFADFYSRDRYAAFQAGTLFLDSRSTELCLRVDGVSPLAAMSKFYIAYCTCTRAGGGATMTIAACFTQGASDYLFVGRNGVFYDPNGALWYAVVSGIVDNPISVRQAFWSPFKKFIRFVEEQVAKRAAASEAAAGARLNAAVEADKPAPEPKISNWPSSPESASPSARSARSARPCSPNS